MRKASIFGYWRMPWPGARSDAGHRGANLVQRTAPAQRGQAFAFDGATLTTVFGPKWRRLLIGAGHLSQAVARLAAMLDFDALMCDPREVLQSQAF